VERQFDELSDESGLVEGIPVKGDLIRIHIAPFDRKHRRSG
jgi:hypothetical protein